MSNSLRRAVPIFLLLAAIVWPAVSDAAQLSLTWADNATNEDGFLIERALGPTGTFTQIATVGPNVTSWVDTGLLSATTYCYRVRAFNVAGNSAYSNPACATTPQSFGLAVVKAGTGSGTVTSAPAGITCGTSCSASYNSGTAVTLTAAAAAGSTFTGWSGGGCSGTGSCTVTVSAATTVTATFTQTPQTVALTVTKAGTGSGTVTSAPAGITCGTTCSATYNSGTAVTLTAAPTAGSTFTGWSGGGCSSTGSCTVTVSAATTVTATFSATLQTFALTVSKAGTGSGTVTSAPAGIACGTTCSASYNSGTAVTLTAAPAAGSTFTGWSGGGCSGTGSCTVTVSAATTVTATFSIPLTLSSITTDKPAPQGIGTSITFTANASGGTAPYQYKWWLWNGTAWNIVQDWSASATFAWRPTTANAAYQVIGWVRSTGNTADLFESYMQIPFAINPPVPARINTIAPDKPSPQGPGVTITFTTSASGGTAPYQYKWWLWNGLAWNIVQDWSASATFVWTPTVVNPNYQVIAWVRSAGNTADMFESYTQLAFPINPPVPARINAIAPDKPSPQGPGVTITFTASASAGTAPYQYKWWLWNGTAWNTVQDWSAGATFVWTPTVVNPNYQVIAWVRSAGNAADVFESYTQLAYPINPPAPARINAITPDKPSPQGPGATITFTASASGGTAPYQYKWWLWNGTAWNIVQDWSASATFAWRPTTANAGYQVIAWVRSAGNAADLFESYTQLAFQIQPATVRITADRVAPVRAGTTITFTAVGSGGTAPYQYKWWLWDGTAWNIVQDWSASATFVWTPTVANPNHLVIAWVRGAGDTADLFESYVQVAFPITP